MKDPPIVQRIEKLKAPVLVKDQSNKPSTCRNKYVQRHQDGVIQGRTREEIEANERNGQNVPG